MKLKKGEISGVVKTQFGYHIIKLEGKTEAAPVKFAEVKDELLEHLKSQKTNQAIVDAIKKAKETGFAKISKF
jgi:parvulin-like peptidyl-prolyl isomerase